MKYYIIYKTSGENIYIQEIEQTKARAAAAESAGLNYVHWDTDIAGGAPSFSLLSPSNWSDTRTYDEKRQSGYSMESDSLLLEYRARVLGDGDDDATAKADWVAARDSVKDKYLKPWADCVASADNDNFTDDSHGLQNNDRVEFSADTLPGGISAETNYYVVNKADNTFEVSESLGGSAIDVTSVGSNVKYRKRYPSE
jgi:hypothetical protein